jgi:hypothetical protein
MAKTFNSEGKMVSFRMLPEIYHSMNLELSDINQLGKLKFQERLVTKEVFINAVLLAYLSRERPKRRKTLEVCMQVVETMLAANDSRPDDDEARIILPAHIELPEED